MAACYNQVMNDHYRPLIVLALGGFCLSVLSFVIWVSVNEGNDGFAVGRVTLVGESSLIVADPFEEQTVVLLSESTRITRSGEVVTAEAITTESFVQVTGHVVDPITIAATSIRLLPPPKHKQLEHETR